MICLFIWYNRKGEPIHIFMCFEFIRHTCAGSDSFFAFVCIYICHIKNTGAFMFNSTYYMLFYFGRVSRLRSGYVRLE